MFFSLSGQMSTAGGGDQLILIYLDGVYVTVWGVVAGCGCGGMDVRVW